MRGFLSDVDNSVQPYGLVIPAGYDPAMPMRLDVVLHGSTNAKGIGELLFVNRHDGGDAGAGAAAANPFIDVLVHRDSVDEGHDRVKL